MTGTDRLFHLEGTGCFIWDLGRTYLAKGAVKHVAGLDRTGFAPEPLEPEDVEHGFLLFSFQQQILICLGSRLRCFKMQYSCQTRFSFILNFL